MKYFSCVATSKRGTKSTDEVSCYQHKMSEFVRLLRRLFGEERKCDGSKAKHNKHEIVRSRASTINIKNEDGDGIIFIENIFPPHPMNILCADYHVGNKGMDCGRNSFGQAAKERGR